MAGSDPGAGPDHRLAQLLALCCPWIPVSRDLSAASSAEVIVFLLLCSKPYVAQKLVDSAA
jgi:hypothetical protein